jgi:hypothetical protein
MATVQWLLVDGKIYDIRDDAFLSSPRAASAHTRRERASVCSTG